MDEQHRIPLVGGADGETALFTLVETGDDCEVQCKYRDIVVRSSAADFFEALCGVRRELAREGLVPLCYGASLNVFPSGMSRSMGGGLKAYRLTKGAQARMADLVEIFATGPDVIPALVETQVAFFSDWLASLRG